MLASNDATRIAINAGAVDVIVSDWLYVSRQRAEGVPLTFVPYLDFGRRHHGSARQHGRRRLPT